MRRAALPVPGWDELELLLEVHRRHGIQPAAESLGVDASTVRRRLRSLEARLRVRLFQLRNGQLVASRDAQTLLQVAEQMAEAASSLRHAALQEVRELRGEIRVSTMEGFAVEYLAPRLARFAAAHPHLRIELVTAARPLSLTDHQADLSLNMVRPRDGPLRVRRVGEFDVGIYASADYLQARGEPQSLADLASHAFVGYVHDLQSVQETRWLNHWVATPTFVFASTSLPAQARAVAAGAGIAALPAFLARHEPSLRRVLPTHPGVRSQWWLVSRAEDKPVHRLQVLGDFIAHSLRADERLLQFQPGSAPSATGARAVESTLRRKTSGRA